MDFLEFYSCIEPKFTEDFKVLKYLDEESQDLLALWKLIKEDRGESDLFKYLMSTTSKRAQRCLDQIEDFDLSIKEKGLFDMNVNDDKGYTKFKDALRQIINIKN